MVGILSMVVRVDRKGRVTIPKSIREALGMREGGLVMIRIVDDKIVLESIEDIVDKYHGIIRVEKWPKDLDEFLVEVIRKWWRRST